MIRPTRAQIDLGCVRRNVAAVLKHIGGHRKLIAMVKADGYGHGAVPVGTAALTAGASHLGVSLFEEGIQLRQADVIAPVVVFAALPDGAIPSVLEHDLRPVLSSLNSAERLNTAALEAGKTVTVHVNIDTGMSRLGFRADDADTLESVRHIADMKGLQLEGILTHCSSSDSDDGRDFTAAQLRRFNEVLKDLVASGVKPGLVHAANTGATLSNPDSFVDMVRLGIGLYGYYPSAEVARPVELEPCLELLTRIVHLKACPPGTPVGYGRTFTTRRPTRIAPLPMGYADGYPRELSNIGKVIVLTRKGTARTICPVIGRVCMDDTMIDVTDAPDVALNDEVIVYSSRRHDPNAIEAVAAQLGTIPYTLTTRLTSRVPRVYVDH